MCSPGSCLFVGVPGKGEGGWAERAGAAQMCAVPWMQDRYVTRILINFGVQRKISVKGTCLKMSILLNGFSPLVHCSSAGFQPPQSSSLFTHFFPLLINMHKHLNGIMCLVKR